MPTEILIETTIPTPQAEEPAPKPAWRAPVITRISLKRTGNSTGSNTDGFGGSL